MPLKLGYWRSRGVTHPIRQLLHITGQEFEDITWGSLPEWEAIKSGLFKGGENSPFANCPFLIDGDFVLTESGAIPYYICHKTGRADLLGKELKDQARVRQIEGVAKDIWSGVVPLIFANGEGAADQVKEAVKEGSKTHGLIKKLSDFLGEKEFFVGYLTYADLLATHIILLVRQCTLNLGAGDSFLAHNNGNLLALAKRVHSLEELATFELNHPYFPDGWMTWFKQHPFPE